MWVLAWWNDSGVIANPTEDDIRATITQLDNQTRIGVVLYYEAPTNQPQQDERLVIVGGERVNVAYWPANSEDATHHLQDPTLSASQTVGINFGDIGIIEYPGHETVTQETALRAALHFFRTRKRGGDGIHWVRES